MKKVQYILVSLFVMILLCVSLSVQAQMSYSIGPQYESTSSMTGSGSVYASSTSFQSTSSMSGSGSVYASSAYTPFESEQSNLQAQQISGRRNDRPTDPGDPMPIGDAWGLLLFAMIGAVMLWVRRVRTHRSQPAEKE